MVVWSSGWWYRIVDGCLEWWMVVWCSRLYGVVVGGVDSGLLCDVVDRF